MMIRIDMSLGCLALTTNQISVVVHLEEVAVVALHGPVVVLGNLLLVFHEDLHPELFLAGVGVVLAMGQLPHLPLLDHHLEEGDGLGGAEEHGQSQEQLHVGSSCFWKLKRSLVSQSVP